MRELESINPAYQSRLAVLRWFARIWAGLVVAFVGFFLLAHVFGSGEGSLHLEGGIEWLRFSLFPLGLITGLVIGWRHEFTGGAVALSSMTALWWVDRHLIGEPGFDPLLASLALPAVLYLVSAALHRSRSQ